MTEVKYESHGVPLEDYELTRHDHRAQEEAERCREWVSRELAKREAQEEAEEAANPGVIQRHAERLARFWERMGPYEPPPDHELIRWRLRFYCGHIVEDTVHRSREKPDLGGCGTPCPDCGRDPVVIVAYEPVGPLADPPALPTRRKPSPPTPRRPTRAELERRVTELEAENRHLREAAVDQKPGPSREVKSRGGKESIRGPSSPDPEPDHDRGS